MGEKNRTDFCYMSILFALQVLGVNVKATFLLPNWLCLTWRKEGERQVKEGGGGVLYIYIYIYTLLNKIKKLNSGVSFSGVGQL